jgi:hypothetical protein
LIPKILTGKTTSTGLIRYLFGKGRANEHIDPHLVASWNNFAPDPGRNPQHTTAQLARQLDQPVRVLGDRAPKDKVWHCPVRADPGDRHLTDAEWADIARRIMHATGIAPANDPEACRWVAVRHAPDHIHIAATLIRQDGKRPTRSYDYKKAQAEARRIETDYDLRRLNPGDGTAATRPTSNERFKAQRTGQTLTSREVLRLRVRQATSLASTEQAFFAALETLDLRLQVRYAPSGDALGYKVALPGDTNAHGDPVYFSGSTLAPDLSLPRIGERLDTTDQPTPPQPGKARRTNAWHQATAAIDRIPNALANDADEAAQAHLAALGSTLDVLPAAARNQVRAQLRQAAFDFERATRSRIRADHQHARALRAATKELLYTPLDQDGAVLAMLLNTTVLALIAAARWHAKRHHAQQEASARRALHQLRAAYRQTAKQPLERLRQQAPPPQTADRYAHHLRQAVPEHAERILRDESWSALTAVMATAERAGHNPAHLLQHAAQQRPLDDARSPAEVLIWRLRRLGDRAAPSPQALAARTRSANATSATPAAQARPAVYDRHSPTPRRSL